MKLNPAQRQRLFIILAAAFVALFILDRVIFTPITKSWQARSAEIDRLKKSVANGRGLMARSAQMQAKWAEMQTQALPKDPAQAEQDLISAFDRWGRSSNIELGSIKPQWKRGTTERYSLLECRVDASGSLATLARFLYEVEKSPLALRIDSVELTARDPQGQKLTLALLVSGLRLSPLERERKL